MLAGVEGARSRGRRGVRQRQRRDDLPRGIEARGRDLPVDFEAIREYPELVKKWLGKVVPMHALPFRATLNCAVPLTARSFTFPRACAA